jgi:hypothetical protein
MKFVERRPFADPDSAARKLVEIANGIETVQDRRILPSRSTHHFWHRGRPIGSLNRQKPFRDVLNVALHSRPLALRGIADKLLDSAEQGDLAAAREVIDRLDGRPVQADRRRGNHGAF